MTLKAIETVYNGYRFRSRLEARWAVFFDEMGIAYKYEPEGYDLGNGNWYLPDFWLPHSLPAFAKDGWGFWAEIKPAQASQDELNKMLELVRQSKHNGLIFQGNPWPDEYTVTKISGYNFEIPRVFNSLAFQVEGDCYCSLVSQGTPYLMTSYPWVMKNEIELQAAYMAARQVRFEHDERKAA